MSAGFRGVDLAARVLFGLTPLFARPALSSGIKKGPQDGCELHEPGGERHGVGPAHAKITGRASTFAESGLSAPCPARVVGLGDGFGSKLKVPNSLAGLFPLTVTSPPIHTYIYIYVCVCVCVFFLWGGGGPGGGE